MKRLILCFAVLIVVTSQSWSADEPGFQEFITAHDGQLFQKDKPFRFISFNIPNLTYTEDNMEFERPSNFRLPSAFEIDDALATIQQMGGRVARIYVLSVQKTNDPPDVPRHILGPDKLNEEAMVVLDQALETANRRGIRLIIPFIDQASWWGGIETYAGFRGKTKAEFFTDEQVKADYKRLVSIVINRVNTRTGVAYKDDKAVLAWELGNELKPPVAWIREMAPYIKQLDTNHLVAESFFTDPDNPGVDIVQDHLYQGDPEAMIKVVHESLKRAAGKKVYMIGEFGFISTEGMRAIMDTTIQEPAITGALVWSLRFHNQDGGYYWHHEPWGSDFFKALHWPGGPEGEHYDETRLMRIVREEAFVIQGLSAPAIETPEAPTQLTVTDGGLVNWRGATGAATYDLQSAASADGPWTTIKSQLTDDAAQYHPLAVDENCQPGETLWYRLRARNKGGTSAPSKACGPVTIRCHTLVDEWANFSRAYRRGGKLDLKDNDARNHKEDCHRVLGAPGAWLAYHVAGRILSARIFVFGEKGAPELEFRTGVESAKGDVIAARAEDFYGGKEMYDFRWPRLYTLTALPADDTGMVITFQNEAQISRVEIEYR
jgi:mannan endo-1,4-beta-mannosidase